MAVLGSLGDLVLALSADTAKFQGDLGRAHRAAEKFGREVGRAIGSVGAALAGLGAGTGLGALVKNAIDTADEFGKMAQKVGTSTEFISQLDVQARLAGASLEQVQTGLTRLAVNAAEAAQGGGEAREAFAALGVSVTDAAGRVKGTQQLFEEVAGKLEDYADGTNKTALAVKLLGKSGAELIPLINSYRETREEAALLNSLVSGETAKAAEQFNDNLTRVGIAVQAIGRHMAVDLLPPLQALSEHFLQGAKAMGEFSTFGRVAKTVLETVAIVGANVKFTFEALGMEIYRVIAAMGALATGDVKGARLIWDEVGAGIARARQELDAFEQRMLGAGAQVKQLDAEMKNKPDAPKLRDMAKDSKEAEDRLKALKAAIMAVHDDAMNAALADQEIEKRAQEQRDQANRGFIESAEIATQQAEGMIYTWDAAGNRIEMTTEAYAELQQQQEKNTKAAVNFGFTFNSALENAILKGGKLSEVVNALAEDIGRMVLRQTVTEPLSKGISGFVTSAIGSLFGGAGGIQNGGFAFAEGGKPPVGMASLVGEKGPELFVPDQAGTIVPNDALGSTSNNFYIDARGADQAGLRRLEAMIAAVNGSIEHRALAAVIEGRSRGNPSLRD